MIHIQAKRSQLNSRLRMLNILVSNKHAEIKR